MAVRAARIEICGIPEERRDAWKELAVSCQRMKNRLWQIWLCHHVNNDSANLLREDIKRFNEWQKSKHGEKPVWSVGCMGALTPHVNKKGKRKGEETPTAALLITDDPKGPYRTLSREFPGVDSQTRLLVEKAWRSTLMTRRSASGSCPGWVAILFGNEAHPSYTRPQPIPFGKQNAKLVKRDGKYICELRIERLEDGKGVVEPCELMLGKRKCASVRSTVDKILAGVYEWKGSNLVYDSGKWFVSICYEMPNAVRPELDASKVLYVKPGRKRPWRVKIAGSKSWKFGGDGKNVEFARQAVIRERSSRKTHYQWSGSNQKGHGRGRADAVWTKLSSRWKDFTKRYNNEVSKQVVNLAIREGCGRIVYMQPQDKVRDSRLLSNVGNDRTSAMTWDYFQFGTQLASKCEKEGIKYDAKKKPAARGMRIVQQDGKAKRSVGSKA